MNIGGTLLCDTCQRWMGIDTIPLGEYCDSGYVASEHRILCKWCVENGWVINDDESVLHTPFEESTKHIKEKVLSDIRQTSLTKNQQPITNNP